MPIVEPLALRASVNEQDGGIPLARLEIGRFDDKALDLHSARREPEILRRVQRQLRDERVVLVRELAATNTTGVCGHGAGVHLGRTVGRIVNPADRPHSLVERESRVVVVGDDGHRRARDDLLKRGAKELGPAGVHRGDVEGAHVGGEPIAVGVPVPLWEQFAR